MYADPLTLSALKVLFPLFSTCNELYKTWHLTKEFGNELFKIESRIDALYARLDRIGSRRRDQLVDAPDPNDDLHHVTKEVHNLLICIKMTFEKCDSLIREMKRNPSKLRKRARPVVPPPASSDPDPSTSLLLADSAAVPSRTASAATSTTVASAATSTTVATLPTTVSGSTTPKSLEKAPSVSEVSTAAPSEKKSRSKNIFLSAFKRKGKHHVAAPQPAAPAAPQASVSNTPALPVAASSAQAPQIAVSDAPAHTGGPILERVEIPKADVDHIPYDRRWKFTSSAKQKMEVYIAELTQFMNSLDHLTEEKSGQGLLPASSTSRRNHEALLRDTVAKTQGALERLHRALKYANGRKYRLALQVTDDFERLGKVFAQQHDYLCLDERHFLYFNLQRHGPDTKSAGKAVAGPGTRDQDRSSTFVAESAVEASASLRHIREDQRAQNLDQCAAAVAEEPSPAMTFERWGGVFPPVPDPRAPIDVHWLFRDRTHSWLSYGTLTELLDSGDMAGRLTVNQRLQLAATVTNAFLYLSRLRSMCRPITLEALKYYVLDGSPPVPPHQFDPLALAPYIDFGFGQAQEVVIGSTARGGEGSLNPSLDLGLGLVQIGKCVSYPYDCLAVSSMEAARSWVDTCLVAGDLDQLLPIDFAEIVRDCIMHDALAEAIPGQSERNQDVENTFLLDKVMRLQELESRFSATTRAGCLIPEASGRGNGDGIEV
ncbi:hypothetical protein VTK73DRAFT_6006 [Phialemonium thermophilum]|uniref:Prion-inhibition and propagation HeLo domain-containing protein n=1 Tax=Phialemonium thermophilum TaxID=223376 RepID=A0ABR3WL38_9PEZI